MTDTLKTTDYILADAAPVACEVAADIGNARSVVLIRSADQPTPIEVAMPSVRTLGSAFSWKLFAARGLPAESWAALRPGEHVLERDGVERFLGALALEQSGAASGGRGSDHRYHDGTTIDFILAAVASALPGAPRVAVRLTTMLPISLWHLAPQVERALAGSHKVRYNGRDVTIQIRSVAVRREAEAALDSLDGDVSGPLVIVDVGGRTANVALFKDGQYRDGATLELGVQVALDHLDDALRGRGLRPLTLLERDELEASLIAGRPYSYICDGQSARIDTFARVQLDATARALVQELRRVVPIDRARRIVLVGGGSYGPLFGTVVRAEIDQVEPGGLRALANVYGALGAVPVKGKGKKK